MPLLDVSDLAADPDFAQSYVIKRRAQSVDNHGWASNVVTEIPGWGVITAASPNALQRLPEDQRMLQTYSLVTRDRIQGPSPGYNADLINWNGSDYVVVDLNDYTAFGAGFVQALIQSQTFVDAAPSE